ncbi:hypothetical protein UL82_02135 [Corynebacterium kutscheri]|uniref:HNH nuclease domain-containing protein n=1 Tax=Corynebacterium kutscheri TaxID=35755 RepID=A0A0F6QYL7_9CORY|nr:HNH endonuclease signature motif containing protein [Corynebacterium kutscheri]AKE40652.1 hypothetical protein UL82_02135 [Corynebacterium kutscheri]VEH11049.1 Endonuclease [Corynebacterium kutscheri]
MTFRQLESATIEQVKRINQESNYVPHSRADLSADNGTGITYLNYRMRTETNQDIIEHLSNLRNRTLPNETPSQALARGIEQTLRLGMNAHSLIKLGVTEALTHIYKPAANTNNQIDATSEKTVQQTTQTAHEIANHILGLAHRDSNECTCKTACTCIDPQWMWNRMRSPYLVVTLGQLLKASTTPLGQFGSIAELVDDVCNNVGAYVVYDEFTRQPLDAGSLVRFSPTLHRMIRAREQSVCAHPDCDTPAEYCEANHIRPWIEGGPTGVNNIVMVCTHHHRQLTNGEAEVHLEADGTIIWRNWRTGFYAKQQKIGRVQEVFTKLFEETSPANAIEDNSSTKKLPNIENGSLTTNKPSMTAKYKISGYLKIRKQPNSIGGNN